MSDMSKKASGVRASSPEATAKRPETWREDKESGGKKSAVGQKDGGLPVQPGGHELASLSESEVGVATKRTKKSVERLDLQAPRHKELTIAHGSGDKLGDIPRTNFQIGKLNSEELKPLHGILFERPGKMASVKKNLRLFNGFPFSAGSDQYLKKRDKLLKNSHLTNAKLKLVCSILDLGKNGTQSELVDRIMTFLVEPKDSGKPLPVKKKQRSRKKTSADSAAKSKKTKSNGKSRRLSSSSSSSLKKSRAPSKSKAIVMDSSSDDEEEEDEEEEEEGEEDKVPDGKASDTEDKSSRTDDEEREEEEDKPESKKTPPPRKRVRRDISDNDSDINEAKKKKPGPKTKKADSSSSSSKNTNAADDTSDKDEPLIKMIKRAPSDDELKETVF